MDPTDIGLFQLAQRRLAWVDRRQSLLAQNIANANTPGYRSRDLAPFASGLAGAAALSRTAAGHLAGPTGGGGASALRPQEVSPNGNGVSVEDQLGRVADTASQQELTLNLVHRYSAMLRTAYGRAG